MSRRLSCLIAAALLLVIAGGLRAQIVTYTWAGRSDYSDLAEVDNWVGGVVPAADVLNTRIVFGPLARGYIYYDAIHANQLKFEGVLRSTELYGWQATNLGSGGIIYAPAGNVTSYLDSSVQLHASQAWNIQSGTFVAYDAISGSFGITKTGAGMLVMDNYASGAWTGGLTLNEGRLGVTWYAGTYGGLGDGTLTINGGTLVAYDPDDGGTQIYIENDVVINGTLTAENQTELQLGYSGDGESSILLATDTTIRSSGEPLFLSGRVTDNEAGRKLTIDSNGAVIIDGPTSYSGGTDVTKGVLIFDRPGLASNLPATGAIKVGSMGYVGITSDDDTAGLIAKLDPTSTGSIGFDSDVGGTFSKPIDLSGLNSSIRIGSATSATLGYLLDQDFQVLSSATITPFGNTYRFGGGGGRLEVRTLLVNLVEPPVVRNVVLDSPKELPLSVFFTNTNNSFTGGVSATHSAAVFASGALPGANSLNLGTGGYIGAMDITQGDGLTQDFINRFVASTDRGMIGFDAVEGISTISDPINLGGFADTDPGIYLGTHTQAHLNGAITPQGNTFRFGAYKGGILTVNSQLTGAGTSVHIGDPNSLGTMGDFHGEQYSRVVLTGNNAYGGTTTLYAGELRVGQTNGVIGTDPTTALGTGALIVQPHSLILPVGQEDVRPQLSAYSGIIIPNALQLNADLTIYGGESSYTLAGNISGGGRIYTDGALGLTLTGNNSAFTGGIYLSGYTFLNLANDTAAGTGPMGFGYSQNLHVNFQSAAPVIGGLYSTVGDYNDYALLNAERPDTVLTINQATDGVFRGEFRSQNLADSLRVVKAGAGTLHLADGGLYVHNGVNVTTPAGDRSVSLQVNAGTLVIDGSFYVEDTDPTFWVNGGTLAVDNGGYVGNPIVLTSGKLAGDGDFNTATIGANAVLSPGLPGTAIGHLDFADLTLAPKGVMEFNVRTADPSANDYDLVSISTPSTLHITAGTTADDPLTTGTDENDRFTLKVISLQADGTPGTLTGLSGDRSYTWTIFDATYSSIEGFDVNKFIVDASQFFTDLPIHTLTLTTDGDLIQLTFQPVPEPSTYALMALGLALVAFEARRRRSRG